MPDRVKKIDKRKLILDAALSVFSQDGFQRSKMEKIAKAADLGKGTLYEYFRSKEELFLAVFFRFKEVVLSRYWRVLEERLDPLSKLQRVAEISSAVLVDEDIQMRFYSQFYLESINREEISPLREILNEYNEELSALVTGIVQQAIDEGLLKPMDAELNSQIFIAAITGLHFNRLLSGDMTELRTAFESLYNAFIKGTGTFAARYVDDKG